MRLLSSLSLFCCMLCSTFAGGVTAQTSAAQEGDVIRIDVDVTNLLFTAADKRNRFITTLREEDIRVLEDGVPQQLFTFQRETDRLLLSPF